VNHHGDVTINTSHNKENKVKENQKSVEVEA